MNENFYLYLSTYTHSILFFIPKKLCIWKKSRKTTEKYKWKRFFYVFEILFFYF